MPRRRSSIAGRPAATTSRLSSARASRGCSAARRDEYLDNPYLWRDRVHPDDVARINDWVDRMFESDERSIEYRIRRADGTYFWVNDQQQMVRDAKGKPVEIVGSWTDVTERKEAEAARETRARAARSAARCGPCRWSTVSPRAAISRPPSSAPISSTCWAISPEEYLQDADFWRATFIPTISPRSRRSRSSCSENGRALRRIPVPQEGRHLLLGQRRAASHSRPERQPARGGRLVERHRRPQGGGAGVSGGARQSSRRRLRRRWRPARPRACSSPI